MLSSTLNNPVVPVYIDRKKDSCIVHKLECCEEITVRESFSGTNNEYIVLKGSKALGIKTDNIIQLQETQSIIGGAMSLVTPKKAKSA